MPAQASPHSSAPDVLDILIGDHNKIIQFFDEFRRIKAHADDETKQTLVEVTCTELVIHAQIEEEFLYPALREAFDDASLIDEADIEHIVARQLISELESMHPDDDHFDAKFSVLGEYVRHHIEEEQNKIFAKIRQSGMDLDVLGKDILQRRKDLRNEFGIPDEGYEEDDEDDGPNQHRKWRYPHHH
jgi:hemerythrin-like domain-containing protein